MENEWCPDVEPEYTDAPGLGCPVKKIHKFLSGLCLDQFSGLVSGFFLDQFCELRNMPPVFFQNSTQKSR